jgi:hypothetical protein
VATWAGAAGEARGPGGNVFLLDPAGPLVALHWPERRVLTGH